MPPIIAALFGFLGAAFKGLFDFKGSQAETVQEALKTLQSINNVDGQSALASAQAIQAILTQGSWLEKQWRPLLMLMLMIIIGSWFFGHIPPNFNAPISPMMEQVIELLKIGVIGYMPCRTLEKIVTQFNIGTILKKLIEKRIM